MSEQPELIVVEPDAEALEAFKKELSPHHKYQLVILYALNHKPGVTIYGGTVSWHEKRRRRNRNKLQRMSRRGNR